jgi:hypothetical protein
MTKKYNIFSFLTKINTIYFLDNKNDKILSRKYIYKKMCELFLIAINQLKSVDFSLGNFLCIHQIGALRLTCRTFYDAYENDGYNCNKSLNGCLISNGITPKEPWDIKVYSAAIKNNCVKILHKYNIFYNPNEKKSSLHWAELAARYGQLESLKYILSTIYCLERRSLDLILEEDVCAVAAAYGHLDCLKYAHENGCFWDEVTCHCAARSGHLECLRYAHENGCEWDKDTCSGAAEYGHIECLRYAHDNGCPWGKRTCGYAALRGYIDCLIYAHENGCRWDRKTCSWAVENGQLDCLIYAHENSCPWDERICARAAKHGHLNCLQYAHENGCPWDKNTYIHAEKNNHLDCLRYARENGCCD